MKSGRKIKLSSATALFVSIALWGLSGPVDKYLMGRGVSFMVLLTVKYVIAAVGFMLIYRPREIRLSPHIKELLTKGIYKQRGSIDDNCRNIKSRWD